MRAFRTRAFRRLALLLAAAALPSAALAHRLDEYLQATLVSIEPGNIRLGVNLTPGVVVAEPALALIDPDRDGVVSPGEAAAYAESVKRDLTVRLDGRDVELKLAGSSFPASADLRTGWGIIRLEFAAAPGALAAGPHQLTLENRHLPAISAYLVNAALPKDEMVRITRQSRNDNQSTGEIEFTLQPPPDPSRGIGIVAPLGALVAALSAGVWRARKRLPRRNGFPGTG